MTLIQATHGAAPSRTKIQRSLLRFKRPSLEFQMKLKVLKQRMIEFERLRAGG